MAEHEVSATLDMRVFIPIELTLDLPEVPAALTEVARAEILRMIADGEYDPMDNALDPGVRDSVRAITITGIETPVGNEAA